MPLTPPRDFRGLFRTDDIARSVYSEAAGISRVRPQAVAAPIDADDVAALVRWARRRETPLTARGSGSSMAGGALGPGVVVDLSRLRALSEPAIDRRMIRVETGALRGEVDRSAARVELCFPVDPSSGEFCTVGGMTATNAAGPHSLRHGSTRPWVLGIECVFDDGSRAWVRRGEPPPREVPAVGRFLRDVHADVLSDGTRFTHANVTKDSSGYAVGVYAQTQELVDLLVGSEGTLAMFTAVELALSPAAGATASLFVSFGRLESAAAAAVAAREAGAAACELLDRTFLGIAARAGRPLPASSQADAALLVEVEALDTEAAAAAAKSMETLFRSLGADVAITAVAPAHEAELWSFRHAASPAIARMDPSLRSMQFIEDAAVPPASLATYVRGVRAVLDRTQTPGVVFGHAGDAHVHVNPLIDVRRADWRQTVDRILGDVTDLVAKLGGTLTGEHGDGRLRTPLLGRVWSREALRCFARVKRAFDPEGVFNPGVKVPIGDEPALGAIKYDPAAEPLPPAADEALQLVERDRAYSRFRLDLV
jgi:FAD/FMN-containing dehydrogenase